MKTEKGKGLGSTQIVYFVVFTTDTTIMTMITAITTPMIMRICSRNGFRE